MWPAELKSTRSKATDLLPKWQEVNGRIHFRCLLVFCQTSAHDLVANSFCTTLLSWVVGKCTEDVRRGEFSQLCGEVFSEALAVLPLTSAAWLKGISPGHGVLCAAITGNCFLSFCPLICPSLAESKLDYFPAPVLAFCNSFLSISFHSQHIFQLCQLWS